MQTSFKRWFYDATIGDWYHENYVDIYGPGNLRLFSWYNQDGSMVYTVRDLSGKILRTWEVSGTPPGSQWTFSKDYLYGAEGMFGSYGNGGAIRFFHSDHLGTPRQITERFGNVVGRHSYYPFGFEVPPGPTYDDRICKYTGHERDRNGGTDYMLGRTYLYPVKRFTTVDPGRDGWNLYAYVKGNPVKYTDPTGLYTGASFEELAAAHEALTPEQKEQFSRAQTASLVATGAVALAFTPGPEDVAIVAVAGRIGSRFAGAVGRFFGKLLGKADEAAEALPRGRSRVNKARPVEGAGPHSVVKRSPQTGEATGYTEFDAAGDPVKRFRAEGKTHGGVDPPLVLEPKPEKGPGSPLNRARPARPDEIPGGNG